MTPKRRGQVSTVDQGIRLIVRIVMNNPITIQRGSLDPLAFCFPQEMARLNSALPTEVRGQARDTISAMAFLFLRSFMMLFEKTRWKTSTFLSLSPCRPITRRTIGTGWEPNQKRCGGARTVTIPPTRRRHRGKLSWPWHKVLRYHWVSTARSNQF